MKCLGLREKIFLAKNHDSFGSPSSGIIENFVISKWSPYLLSAKPESLRCQILSGENRQYEIFKKK